MHFQHSNSALEIHERCHSLSRFMHTINVFRYYCVLGYIPLTVKSTHRSVPSSSTTRHWIIFLLITLRFVLLGLGSDAAAASIASGSPALRALRLLRKRNIFGGLPCRVMLHSDDLCRFLSRFFGALFRAQLRRTLGFRFSHQRTHSAHHESKATLAVGVCAKVARRPHVSMHYTILQNFWYLHSLTRAHQHGTRL